MYIPIPYRMIPRHYQRDMLQAIKNNINVLSVIHRRAGKDIGCMQALLLRALVEFVEIIL